MATNTELTAAALECFAGIVDELDDPLTVLEFGACDGYHTALLAAHLEGREFRYYTFEPLPELSALLAQRAPTSVTVIRAAIGAIDGEARFWRSGGRDYYGSSSLRRPAGVKDALPGVSFAETEVPVMRLDTFARAAAIDRVDFIWSDIQGAEGDMIEGGRETLARTRWLYTEADGNGLYEGDVDEAEICELLPGFQNMGRVADSLLLRNRAL